MDAIPVPKLRITTLDPLRMFGLFDSHGGSAIKALRSKRRSYQDDRERFLLTRSMIDQSTLLSGSVWPPTAVSQQEQWDKAQTGLKPSQQRVGNGLIPRPSKKALQDRKLGGVKVSVGREDSLSGDGWSSHEVKTSGWIVVRFIPRATGLR